MAVIQIHNFLITDIIAHLGCSSVLDAHLTALFGKFKPVTIIAGCDDVF